MKSFVIFGAGAVGRSFLAPLFARGGYEPCFIDTNERLVSLLNERRAYTVVVKRNEAPDRAIEVRGFRAVSASRRAEVEEAVAEADLAATAVGKNALPAVMASLVGGLDLRRARSAPALDVILAENVRSAASWCAELLSARCSAMPELLEAIGLVEASIGKMVPLMPAHELEQDPLRVFAEPYDTLIVSRKDFKAGVPDVEGLEAVDPIEAYIERKLFMHNLGHAAAAYLGFRAAPQARLLWQVLALPEVRAGAHAAMLAGATALLAERPGVFTPAGLRAHAQDLLERFDNQALGDTVHRVGRDLARKLHRSDRVVGAALLAEAHGLDWEPVERVFRAALGFHAVGADGRRSAEDEAFLERLERFGLSHVLTSLVGLRPEDPLEGAVLLRLAGP